MSASPERTNDLVRREIGTRTVTHRDAALGRCSGKATATSQRERANRNQRGRRLDHGLPAFPVTSDVSATPSVVFCYSNSNRRTEAPKLEPPLSISAHNTPIQWSSNFLAAGTVFLKDNFSMDSGIEGWFRDDSSAMIQVHCTYCALYWVSLVAQMVKSLLVMQETWVQSLGWEDTLEKKMATHSSILAWEFPRTEEPGRLQSMGLQRIGHD